jgi:hypothetical protein
VVRSLGTKLSGIRACIVDGRRLVRIGTAGLF